VREPSRRDLIRAEALKVLKESGAPVHFTDIAAVVLARLGLESTVTAKTLNTSLHDDPEGRFKRVGLGRWIPNTEGP
jgi:hypothetical protein